MDFPPTLPRAVVAILAASLLAAAGCGGDDDGAGPTTTTETTTETTTSTTTDTTTAGGEGPSGPRSCGDVAFEPETDAGAFGIEARGVSCETARAVAGAAEGEGTSYSARGFDCTGTEEGGELPSVEFECARGEAEVSFSAS